jgi:hypothetical protein
MTKARSRREFITSTIGGAALLGVKGIGASDLTELNNDSAKPGAQKLKILVAGGHPGDPEYGCGGTIARYSEAGNEVVLLYLNRGEGGIQGKSGSSKQPDLYYYEVSDGEDTLMFYSLQSHVSEFRGIECGHKHAEAFVQQISSHSALFSPAM